MITAGINKHFRKKTLFYKMCLEFKMLQRGFFNDHKCYYEPFKNKLRFSCQKCAIKSQWLSLRQHILRRFILITAIFLWGLRPKNLVKNLPNFFFYKSNWFQSQIHPFCFKTFSVGQENIYIVFSCPCQSLWVKSFAS